MRLVLKLIQIKAKQAAYEKYELNLRLQLSKFLQKHILRNYVIAFLLPEKCYESSYKDFNTEIRKLQDKWKMMARLMSVKRQKII